MNESNHGDFIEHFTEYQKTKAAEQLLGGVQNLGFRAEFHKNNLVEMLANHASVEDGYLDDELFYEMVACTMAQTGVSIESHDQ
ncbi:MAG: hypothetical protein WBL70_03465 [Candidatus Acidiferrales bacterium]